MTNHMLEEQHWNNLRRKVASTSEVPIFASKILEMSWPDIKQKLLATVESKILNESYLSFLDEQIQLGARGEVWTDVLSRRKSALKPYVGKPLTTVSITSENGLALVIKFDPVNLDIVLIEALE